MAELVEAFALPVAQQQVGQLAPLLVDQGSRHLLPQGKFAKLLNQERIVFISLHLPNSQRSRNSSRMRFTTPSSVASVYTGVGAERRPKGVAVRG